MPNRADNNPLPLDAVQDNVRSAPNHQLPNPRLSPDPAKMRMIPERFNHGDNAYRKPFRRLRFVPSHIRANLPQPGSRQYRPDNLYWHKVSSSCSLPQAHFGTGNSSSVPHESSQAFMSSFLM